MSKLRTNCLAVEILEAVTGQDGVYKVTVIRPGFNKSKGRFYPAEVLKRDGHIFKGSKMFANHATEAEVKARPEGSVNDWVATLTEVNPEADGSLMGTVKVHDPVFEAKLQGLKKQDLLGEMGVSIRAIGEGEKREHQGVNTIVMESLLKARSVDFVTYAGAGGAVQTQEAEESLDLDVIGVDQLRQARPDLVSAIESSITETQMNEQEMKDKVAAAEAAKATAEANVAVLASKVTALESAAKVQAKEAAQTAIAKLITESKLPKPAQERLVKQFAASEAVTGVAEAIASETEYLKSIGHKPAAKVTGNGKAENGVQESDDDEPTEAQVAERRKSVVESYIALGFSKEAAEKAAA